MAQGRDAPCRDCKKRHMGCHSECEEYKRFDEECEQRRRQRALQGETLDYVKERCHEVKRRMSRK